ncbi:MAG: alpha/beta hydrolase, partial [Candidatus Micrarchaeota archaeon]|nr:alpha/beta hydrolase [Candidatus Micrarchaeota archaeon]
SNFYATPIEWERIRKACGSFTIISSDNDPYVDLKYGNELKEKLGAKQIIEHSMGHFNVKELHVSLNELLKMILQG